MVKTVPIVVVAFNRPKSLSRILKSLDGAKFDRNDIPLIISIDKGDNADVLKVAEDFQWRYGEKIVIYQKENLKLRKHILKCGGYALEYGSVIILEDDLFVSPYFYEYTMKALKFSEDKEYIGGISLYNHRYNVVASEPFEPMDDGYDNWYFQFASSWGEAWTADQWKKFIDWYNQNPDIDSMSGLPQYVKKWPASSWLKYFIAFLIEKDRYFLYPRKSATTNFGDAGTHVNCDNTNFQVPLQMGEIEYRFSEIGTSKSVYDAYFENLLLCNLIEGKKTNIDLYGKKTIDILVNADYLLSRNSYNYEIVRKYGCSMRPHDANILNGIIGNDFFLYDLSKNGAENAKFDSVRKAQYNLRYIDHSQYNAILKLFANKTSQGLKRKYKELFKKYK